MVPHTSVFFVHIGLYSSLCRKSVSKTRTETKIHITDCLTVFHSYLSNKETRKSIEIYLKYRHKITVRPSCLFLNHPSPKNITFWTLSQNPFLLIWRHLATTEGFPLFRYFALTYYKRKSERIRPSGQKKKQLSSEVERPKIYFTTSMITDNSGVPKVVRMTPVMMLYYNAILNSFWRHCQCYQVLFLNALTTLASWSWSSVLLLFIALLYFTIFRCTTHTRTYLQ